jgi:tRNA-dihydrouridine synthase A
MMDWTDRHCRHFHRLLSPSARLYTEMVHAHAVLRGDRERLLGFSAIEHPVALQLGGSDAGELAEAAKIGVAEFGYDEVNLNVGCPSDRVQAGRFGACLMREPSLVAECIAAMRGAVSVPVTVKCRIGVDDQDSYADLERFVSTVAATGCDVFILHARKAWLHGLSPKQNREVPPLDYERVFALKREHPGLTIVLNGGITSEAAARDALARLDGVMIGRMAYHDPYQLALLERALCDPAFEPPERAAVLAAFEPYAQAHLARGDTLNHLARHLVGLFQGQPGARRYRRVLTELSHRREAGWDAVEAALAAQSQQPEARAA